MLQRNYDSPIGRLILIVSGRSLVYCGLDVEECRGKMNKIKSRFLGEATEEEEMLLLRAGSQLDGYFRGERRKFDLPLYFEGTPFQMDVWKGISEVAYGETITYTSLAAKIGNEGAVRAVANACGKNPISIIIGCHRIVGSGGSIGGYTGGVDKKRILLALEREE